jgi:putative tryptophan/tyrosine transport system substrate-binding protein
MNSRRKFLTLLGGAAAACPLVARAQQAAKPVVGFVIAGSQDMAAERVAAFRSGLSEGGYVEGRNVTIEYHFLGGQYDHLPALMADLVRRRVAVIATPGSTRASRTAKEATATIPIVFGVAEEPVRLGLVASLARPGGNVTGVNFFSGEVGPKRLELLHKLVPKAMRIAILVNPTNNGAAEAISRDLLTAARSLGVQLRMLKARNSGEIETAFMTLTHEPADALYVVNDPFFASQAVQLAKLAVDHAIPMAHSQRDAVEAGALMSYGADFSDWYKQVGVYTGRILGGEKPADLPVVQPTKFVFAVNLQTARLLGLDVPPTLLAIADEVIEQ